MVGRIITVNGIHKTGMLNKHLLARLEKGEKIRFELNIDRKESFQDGLRILLIIAFTGLIIGAILELILLLTDRISKGAFLGIAIAVGLVSGLIFSIIFRIGTKKGFVAEMGEVYGMTIGVNVTIGVLLGGIISTGIGALFGLMITVFGIEQPLGMSNIPLGIIIWIGLGLNIGVCGGLGIGLLPYGETIIIPIFGVIVGFCAAIAIFGFNMMILAGIVGGIIFGGIIGGLMKYAVGANLGLEREINRRYRQSVMTASGTTQSSSQSTSTLTKYQPREPEPVRTSESARRSRRTSDSYGSSSFFDIFDGFAGDDDCSSIIMFFFVIIALFVLIVLVFRFGEKATKRIGKNVKKGTVTLIVAITSIGLVTGFNIGLSNYFHNLYTFGTVAIGGGLGAAFGLIVAGIFLVENKKSYLLITPTYIKWKNRTREGQLSYEDLERITIVDDKTKKGEQRYEQIVIVPKNAEEEDLVPLDCWKIKDEIQSTENMREILSYCMDLHERRKEEREQERRNYAEERQIEIKDYGEEERTIIDGQVIDQIVIKKIKRLIKKEGKNIEKLSSQTNIPVKTLEKVLFQRLGLVVHAGKIYSWEEWEKEAEKELEKRNIKEQPEKRAKIKEEKETD